MSTSRGCKGERERTLWLSWMSTRRSAELDKRFLFVQQSGESRVRTPQSGCPQISSLRKPRWIQNHWVTQHKVNNLSPSYQLFLSTMLLKTAWVMSLLCARPACTCVHPERDRTSHVSFWSASQQAQKQMRGLGQDPVSTGFKLTCFL